MGVNLNFINSNLTCCRLFFFPNKLLHTHLCRVGLDIIVLDTIQYT